MPRRAHRFFAIGALCFASQLLSCTAGLGHATGGLRPAANRLPDIATLDSRRVCGVADVSRDGKDTLAQSSGVLPIGLSLYVSSTQGSSEWAIYQLTPTAGMRTESVDVDVTGDEGWVGIADYGKSDWQLTGPFGVQQSVDLSIGNYISPSGHVYVAVITTGAHGVTVTSVTLHASGNLPPVASFTATPQSGTPGQPVTLDASGSSDSDGNIVDYAWDLDGDGSFELDNGLVPSAPTTLPSPTGSVDVGLQVTDDGGLSNTATVTLSSAASAPVAPLFIEAAAANNAFGMISMAIVNGNPAIAYQYWTGANPTEIRYARATTADGGTWGNPIDITAGAGGGGCSLTVIDGKPAVGYVKGQDLMFVQAQEQNGGAWNSPVIANAGHCANQATSLKDVNGKPGLIMCDTDGGQFVHALDADGNSWGNRVPVTTISGVWADPWDLAVVDGRPAVAFHGTESGGGQYACFVRANDADGTAWGTTLDVIASTNVPAQILCDAGGRPGVFSMDGSNLAFARASDIDGTAWGVPAAVAATTSNCVGVVAGKPAFVIINGSMDQFIAASTPDASSWDTPFNCEKSLGTMALADVAGGPGIAYVVKVGSGPPYSFGLKYAKLW
jgi:hypothetical protein